MVLTSQNTTFRDPPPQAKISQRLIYWVFIVLKTFYVRKLNHHITDNQFIRIGFTSAVELIEHLP